MIEPGKTLSLLLVDGPGCIKHVYWTYIIDEESVRRKLFRYVIVRMYWDGETTPSVECPLGDFFGVSNGALRPLRSLALVVNPGSGASDVSWGFNSYFPMPFSDGARIEVSSEADVPLSIWYHVDYETYPSPPSWLREAGRFHAQFRRAQLAAVIAPQSANKTGQDNYVILEAVGHGSLAGYVLGVDNITGGWWGEGDDMVFLDGESWPPSLHGTGSEEIFGGGACPDVEYTGPYTGFYLVENPGKDSWYRRNGMYRFFVHDPIRFRESIRVTIEHGHANDRPNDYSSVAYWYQVEPHGAFPALPSPQGRMIAEYPPATFVDGAIEAERLLENTESSGDQARPCRLPGEWSAWCFLLYMADSRDDFITLRVPVETDGIYDVVLYLAKASDFGTFQLKIDDKETAVPFDGYNGKGGTGPTHVVGAEEVHFGTLDLSAGSHRFEFRLVDKNPHSTSYMLGVDCIVLRRHK